LVYSRLIDQFDQKAATCLCDADLRALLDDMARELGFRFFALLHHASLSRGSGRLVRIDNYPEGWEEELIASGLASDDPVHLASTRVATGFCWEKLGKFLPLSRNHREILARSRRHGIGAGFTVPANVPGEPSGSCSFAVRLGRELPRRRLLCAEQIGAHAFETARRIHHYPEAREHPRLSRRQLQCLRLVARGKTDWEIATILGIGVETVHLYVKRARAAYDVVSRTQLVVQTLLDGTISFDDAIPPDG
jgi:LuxR family quorum-sensing system transcriptional regulator CciR